MIILFKLFYYYIVLFLNKILLFILCFAISNTVLIKIVKFIKL